MWSYWFKTIAIIASIFVPAWSYPTYHVDSICHCKDNNATYELGEVESTSSAMTLKAKRYHMCKSDINCTIHIIPPTNHGMVLNFLEIHFPEEDVCHDYIKIYDIAGSSADHIICQNNRRTYLERTFNFTKEVTLLYHVEHLKHKRKRDPRQGFELSVSSYIEKPCPNDTFQCGNGRCISSYLQCDDINNCGDDSDEAYLLCEYPGDDNRLSVLFIAFGVMMGVAFVVGLLLFLLRFRPSPRRTISKELLVN